MLRQFLRFSTRKYLHSDLTTLAEGRRYAGHSKWANIRHTKGAKDAQRGALFTKLGHMMRVAIIEGKSVDPKMNLRLEQVLEQARRANMPSATVQSIIKSATTKGTAQSYQLEIKGPGSCMILVDVFTDNLHHIKQNITTIMKKHGSKYADGGARHLFEQKGIILAERPKSIRSDEAILEKATDDAIECGAEDVRLSDDDDSLVEFHCAASSLRQVAAAVEKLYTVTSASVEYIPLRGTELSEPEMAECARLLDKLDALPDVVQTYHNIL